MKTRHFAVIVIICLSLLMCRNISQLDTQAQRFAIYPREENFLETMSVGDTVHVFIKTSGYFNPNRNSSYSTHLTCYTRLEIFRADTFLYLSRKYFAIPGGQSQSGPDFEFDTVRCNLELTMKSCGLLDPYCERKYDLSTYAFQDSCLLREADATGKSSRAKEIIINSFTKLGMCDSVYNEWRFNPPSYETLKAWRESMNMNEPRPFWRYEVLSFYRDTCKISYSDRLPISFPFDYTRLR
jgi:hypothetical protein